MKQHTKNKLLILGIAGLLSFAPAIRAARAQDSAAKADNTAQNASGGQTAQDQSTAKADRDTTAKIRRAIIADKDLSMYAHNVKIITRGGTVTLRGPVKSEDEKQKVESDAASVVSHDSLVDQLTVKQ